MSETDFIAGALGVGILCAICVLVGIGSVEKSQSRVYRECEKVGTAAVNDKFIKCEVIK